MKKFIKELGDSLNRNLDFMVKVATIGGALFAAVTVIMYLQLDIKTQINESFNDTDIIEKLAKELRTPFLIFNSDGIVLYDNGGTEFVKADEIQIDLLEKPKNIKRITITTKQILNIPPILSSIDDEVFFKDAKKFTNFKWEYETIFLQKLYMGFPKEGKPVGRFKLEILK